jgi:putative ABC transport system permease protein
MANMNFGRLIKHNLRYFWRTHLGVVLGAAVATAVLTGALLVGDSVRYSLRQIAKSRLGETQIALMGQNRFFRTELAEELGGELNVEAAPVLQLSGMLINNEKDLRRNRVQVLGVEERFWRIGNSANPFGSGSDEIVLNESLAGYLQVQVGDEVLLRVRKPDLLPREAMLSLDRDFSQSAGLTVTAIVTDKEFGRFDLQANQLSPLNAFVPLDWLDQKIKLAGRANLLLLGGKGKSQITVEQAEQALAAKWELADASLSLRKFTREEVWELRSDRIFMEPVVGQAAAKVEAPALGIFSYFVNDLRIGEPNVPYSIVTAVGTLSKESSSSYPTALGKEIPVDLGDNEILINEWLARDLYRQKYGLTKKELEKIEFGKIQNEFLNQNLALSYYVMTVGRKLEVPPPREFRIRTVLPMAGAVIDPNLMPDFPGMSEAQDCDEWEAGIDLDLGKIRGEDEEYWDLYRGTPKAFIHLKTGQALWENRFGNLTAVRYPLDAVNREVVSQTILKELSPVSVGLSFLPVGHLGEQASGEALDFGMLFLGLSFFLITAALVLMGLLFVFGIEQRGGEIGTLLALGYMIRRVRLLFLLEGSLLAVVGSILGVLGSILYTKGTLWALSTVWQGAIASAAIQFHARPVTLVLGLGIGVIIAVLSMWITLWRQGRQPIRELVSGLRESVKLFKTTKLNRGKLGYRIAILGVIAALVLLFLSLGTLKGSGALVFFLSGTLLLISGMALVYGLLNRWALTAKAQAMQTIGDLGLRNSCRRRGRSLAVVILLAVGSFMVFAVGANRHNAETKAEDRSSGTGGFQYIAESSLPILHDLNTKNGRKSIGLEEEKVQGARFVQFRVRQGDDASCLNLNRAQKPRLLGVRPDELAQRKAFRVVNILADAEQPWLLLKNRDNPDVIPAFTDFNTIKYALGKNLGETLDYVDEQGRPFQIQLVGALANSILQGNLIIDEAEFIRRYPSEVGYRFILVDAKPGRLDETRPALERAGRNYGLDVTPATQRLADFYAVENTYLEIFQLLGGLGMLLGSVGLALVVIRNVMERRGELAMLRAVGMEKKDLVKLLLYEHWWLLVMGLACGVVSALVAVWPALRSGGNTIPYGELGVTLLLLLGNGLLWIWLAAKPALRGELITALRNE